MSTTDQANSAPLATTKKKTRRGARAGHAKALQNDRVKTIVRRLPPNLPEEIFWQSVQKWVSDDTVSWKAFFPGKLRKKLNKENIYSRAYIAFKTEQSVTTFSREYDGHVFRDKAGNESQAVVEFAPYQKLPPPVEKRKHDNRAGTIERDEDYITFMQTLSESLGNGATKPLDTETLLETLIASTAPQQQPTTTPLLDALKAEKTAQKDKEAIQRNHPHYKDAGSKKEEKKKSAAAAPASNAVAPTSTAGGPSGKDGATLGKRAAKKARAEARAAAASITAGDATLLAAAPTQGASFSGSRKSSAAPAPSVTIQGKSTQPTTSKKGRGTQQAPPQPPQPVDAPPSGPAPAEPSGSGPPVTAPQQTRRSRPVLAVSARHFEAALSGAGVQKAKREPKSREKDKDEKADGKGKDREPEREQQRSKPLSGKTPIAGPPASANLPSGPTILQRDSAQQPSKIMARPGEAVTPTAAESSSGRGSAGGGGGGRGRGKGRGKVTPANRGGAA